MQPRIQVFSETRLVGKKLKMSFANNRTVELWRSFSPRRREINDIVNEDLFSVEIYSDANFMQAFDVSREFEKWAAIAVNSFGEIPHRMDKLIIPEGLYAVFNYRGKPSEALPVFRYIYSEWLPASPYEMDGRPYFARMGEKYRGEDPESEEEFWIPIRKRG
ncbi:MAG: GyrI-like domain-containing protein [Saprospiraceae bacterium]|nr:GyrI-like domain-containing protein [Saprospiraceae bacterium]